MEYKTIEKPKSSQSRRALSPAKLVMLVLIILLAYVGFQMVNDYTNKLADQKLSSPEFIATESAELVERFPEFVDWERQVDRNIAMWLPKSYQPYPIDDMVELLEYSASEIPSELIPFIDIVRNNPDMIRFVSYDMSSLLSGFVQNVNVMREYAPGMTLDGYIKLSLKNMPSSATVVEQFADFTEGHYPTKRSIITFDNFTWQFSAISYVIPKDGYFYTFTFSASADDLDGGAALADKAMASVRIYLDDQK